MKFSYKKEYSLEERKKQYEDISNFYPGKIPVILERAPSCKINKIIKRKYILPDDLRIYEFIKIIKDKLDIIETQSIYLMVEGKYALTGDNLLSTVYLKYKSIDDGLLYIAYDDEVVFGSDKKVFKLIK